MQNLRVGHYTHFDHATGVSVFVFDHPAPTVYHLCGSAPATRDIHTVEFEANITHIDGLVLLGGSALGLGAADGVVKWLREKDRGYPTAFGSIPIVPSAAIYDLSEKSTMPPTA